jgi:inward rectifier potassium channel
VATASPKVVSPSPSAAPPEAKAPSAAPPPGGHRLNRQDPREALRVGGKRGYLDDLYHYLLQARWSRVLVLVASTYLAINLVFACVYLAGGDAIAGAQRGSFGDAFFFSVQTFSTIGYGTMAPKTTYGSVVVTLEAFVGLVTVAMATGLMFAKFSRPTARILFSDKMVIGQRDGKPTLMLRIANERGNDVIEASFRVTVLKAETTAEGERMRRLHDLPLVRGDTPLFSLTFQGMHVIDEKSPLHEVTPELMEEGEMRFIVTVTGLDATFATTIHARHIYHANDVVFGARFVDVISNAPDGRLILDYGKFHDVVRI